MLTAKLRTLILGSLIALACGTWATPCQAGPVLDWLAGRPVTYSYPWYSAQQHSVQPYSAYRYSAYRPFWYGSSRHVVGYAPQTVYRTRWNRVPVTYYRPVANIDPATGTAVTCMRPCTSYQWQVQRVPVTTYRTVYAPVNRGYGCATTPSCGTAYLGSTAGCNSCSTATVAPATPYYQPTIPNYQPTLPGPTAVPQSAVPADKIPSLKPNATQGASLLSPVAGVTPAKVAPVQNRRQPARAFNLQLIPKPEPQRSLEKSNKAPRLLNPHDRTASGTDRSAHRSRVVRASSASKRQETTWDDSGWRSAK